ncbi:phage major capsid protein [Brevibacterium linens]|uniref:Phage major capsid protein, HK97 family n=1 Tax=Brevibacterium linens ATCC 9172 TaxID=1255617 RepID=A0A2H1J460_BRELN|nr:phage major capsid protein [Brevibacterium linens]KAB1942290.1 phage major capsid protein [Brevibacterium linens ATCC 9172]SMX82151.1 phage major capsid protein, HK97 family [Brevibacterium linens ATCC 9172]
MATENTTANPELLQEQVQSILIQPLEAKSVVLKSGVKIYDSASPLRIPKLVSSSDPSWVGEGEEIPEANVEFDEVKLMPTDRKSIKTIIRFTNELARQSVVGLDATLKARLVNDVARKLDTALLTGDGTNNSVTGFINQAGVQKGVLDASDPDSLLDALAMAYAAEVEPSQWFMSGTDFNTLRKLKDADGKYLVVSDVTAGAKYSLFGIPVEVTNKLPEGKAVLANMSEVAVVRDVNADVKILDQTFASTDEQAIRVVTRYDLGLLHPEGVIVLDAASGA